MGKPKQAAANPVRGEFLIPLDGADHVMRPTWEAVVAFETVTGKSLIALANASLAGNLTVREMGVVAGECIRAYGKAENVRSHSGVNDQAVMRCIVDMGPVETLKYVQPLLTIAATGGVDAEGNVKAPTTGKTIPSTEGGATEN